MNRETAAQAQLIELRAKGWTYEKIARHTGIDQKKLLAWGIRYKDFIDAEREIIRAALEETRRRRAEASKQPARPQTHRSTFQNVSNGFARIPNSSRRDQAFYTTPSLN